MRNEKIVEKMCHAPADCFNVSKRGYVREGYWADLVVVDLHKAQTVSKDNIQYLVGWSPLENKTFDTSIFLTMVSGNIVFENNQIINQESAGMRLIFES